MFCHISIDEVCRKIEELLPNKKKINLIPFNDKKKPTLHTTLKKKLTLFKTLKVVVHHAQLLEKKTPFTNA
jgi:adenine C2-methylase RlmN of 23S rRNA A2503 and tRNA A37